MRLTKETTIDHNPNGEPAIAAPNGEDEALPTRFIPPNVPATMRRGSFLPTEDPADDRALLKALAESLRPRNLIEFLPVKEAADAARRIRRPPAAPFRH